MQTIQNRKHFAENLMTWYEQNKRDLPWRNTGDPYAIWLSEVILQQTRVNQGLPYYHSFLKNYPNVHRLAAAEEYEILRRWQGLGYYSRAKNLHACAKAIVENWQGNFPEDYKDLLSLKGIGKYTAAAIASFAFGKPVAVVDGNVYRVLSRVFGLFDDIASPVGQRRFSEFAQCLLPENEAATYNQAIMEFGAIQCSPKKPLCEECVCKTFCYAYKNNVQQELPVKHKKIKITHRFFNYFVIRFEHQLLMKERQHKDIWNGLYDFLMKESSSELTLDEMDDEIQTLLQLPGTVITDTSLLFKHQLTHQRLFVKFFLIDLKNSHTMNSIVDRYGVKPYGYEAVKDLPKPILIDNYLSKNIF